MMRSLWTAASGMKSQQTSLDTISNNLANINTTGYKKERTEFQSLLYQTIQNKTTDTEGNPKPIGAQVGLGVKVAAISTEFEQGEMTASTGDFDFAINGSGFFMIQMPDGSTGYTRNGNFVMAINGDGGMTLTTSNGYAVLDSQGQPITFDANTDISKLQFDNYGNIFLKNAQGVIQRTGIRIGAAQFNNPSGLTKIGDSYFAESAASGAARIEGQDAALKVSVIKNGYLESSSVQAVDEMVDMIVTQRAYEMNSKAIQASDEMLQQANNLRQ
ncbi:MAG: flagellar basal-body rod protein FlgG [Butyribacter sp.]|nr:flagellar basal-body rod protein FlgG [bacterium]MDY3853620.1 flagellar basal-body rod protein FlgG [Butyribacter sp.]